MSEDDPIEKARREQAAKASAHKRETELTLSRSREECERLLAAIEDKIGPKIQGRIEHPEVRGGGLYKGIYVLNFYGLGLKEGLVHILCVLPVKDLGEDREDIYHPILPVFEISPEPDSFISRKQYRDIDFYQGRIFAGSLYTIYRGIEAAITELPEHLGKCYVDKENSIADTERRRVKQAAEDAETARQEEEREAYRKQQAKRSAWIRAIFAIPLLLIALIYLLAQIS
ncbi:MAG: hypothetical protein JKP96_01535 [Oceanicaulis sp.]|jgi:hypothetical protein|nr:hypothetical protein [Oceanicaulis sp.]